MLLAAPPAVPVVLSLSSLMQQLAAQTPSSVLLELPFSLLQSSAKPSAMPMWWYEPCKPSERSVSTASQQC